MTAARTTKAAMERALDAVQARGLTVACIVISVSLVRSNGMPFLMARSRAFASIQLMAFFAWLWSKSAFWTRSTIRLPSGARTMLLISRYWRSNASVPNAAVIVTRRRCDIGGATR